MAKASKTFSVYDPKEDEIFTVEMVGRRCECSGSQPCAHVKLITGLVQKDPTHGYLAMSALHKEIRRSHLSNAKLWLNWAIHVRGESRVKKYLKGILFEETRNLDLWRKWRKSTRSYTAEQMVDLLVRSRKKWELHENEGVEPLVYRGVVDAAKMDVIDADDMKAYRRGKYEFYRWWLMFQRVFKVYDTAKKDRFGNLQSPSKEAYEELRAVFLGLLLPVLKRRGLEEEAQICEKGFFHEALVALEALTGQKDPLACTYHDDAQVGGADPHPYDAMLPPAYVFDAHTSFGKGRMRRADKVVLLPATPMPFGLDLRWSGQALGFWWRARAFQEFGLSYRDKPWSSVSAPSTREWALVLKADKIWRNGMAEKVRS